MENLKTLMIQIKRGDKNSFADLYRVYFHRIHSFLQGLLQDRILAEEITQDVFFRLWVNREKLNPEMMLESYLFTIAKNTVINIYKQRSTEQKYLQAQVETMETSTTEENLYYKELQKLIDTTVEAMPQQQRIIFRLSRNEGLQNTEIASQLHISKRTVEKHISNALTTLRKTIGKNYLLFFSL